MQCVWRQRIALLLNKLCMWGALLVHPASWRTSIVGIGRMVGPLSSSSSSANWTSSSTTDSTQGSEFTYLPRDEDPEGRPRSAAPQLTLNTARQDSVGPWVHITLSHDHTHTDCITHHLMNVLTTTSHHTHYHVHFYIYIHTTAHITRYTYYTQARATDTVHTINYTYNVKHRQLHLI